MNGEELIEKPLKYIKSSVNGIVVPSTEYRHQRSSLNRREEVMKNLDKGSLSILHDVLQDFLESIGLSTRNIWRIFLASFLLGILMFIAFRLYIEYYFK